PVYERVGGHAYGSVYPGPIGAVLTPQMLQVSSVPVTEALPFASTLCGACAEVCPVDIDIPRLLVHLRSRTVEQKRARGVVGESVAMAAAGVVLSSPKRLEAMERLGGWSGALIFRRGRIRSLPGPLSGWTTTRDAPLPARRPFRTWWRLERGAEASSLDDEGYASRKVVKLRRDSDAGIHHALRTLVMSVNGCVRRVSEGEPSHCRQDVIEAVRRALRDVPMAPVEIPRAYLRDGQAAIKDPAGLFVERFLSYRGHLSRALPSTLSDAITEALRKEGSTRIVVPNDVPHNWLPLGGEFAVERDDGSLTARDLDQRNAAIVGCSLAIAETGTVVLDSGARQGRRALSLVPDHLVVVVRSDQVVPGVPDAVRLLSSDRNQTWISGPSATVDIELNRVEGVHGPRKLDVVLVERQ
ncbi:MAG: LutC/YkgG family protein, partial [Acidimicrobiales bacterium]